jgi:hypothetical protein
MITNAAVRPKRLREGLEKPTALLKHQNEFGLVLGEIFDPGRTGDALPASFETDPRLQWNPLGNLNVNASRRNVDAPARHTSNLPVLVHPSHADRLIGRNVPGVARRPMFRKVHLLC